MSDNDQIDGGAVHAALLGGSSIEELARNANCEFRDVTFVWRQWSRENPARPGIYEVSELIRRSAYNRCLSRPGPDLRLTPTSDPAPSGGDPA